MESGTIRSFIKRAAVHRTEDKDIYGLYVYIYSHKLYIHVYAYIYRPIYIVDVYDFINSQRNVEASSIDRSEEIWACLLAPKSDILYTGGLTIRRISFEAGRSSFNKLFCLTWVGDRKPHLLYLVGRMRGDGRPSAIT